MKVPLLKVVALGEFSSWARSFLKTIEEKEVIEVTVDSNVDHFCRALIPSAKPTVVLIDNNSESRKAIEQICGVGKPIYIIWIGKTFSKEDLSFACEQRVYSVFESVHIVEKEVLSKFRTLSQLVESDGQFNQILRAMKSILLQTEAEFPNIPMVSELRTALKRLESHGLKNELNHLGFKSTEGSSENLFHKTQTLGDALITINELERTGALWVRGSTADQEGKIDFIQGKITMATAGGCEGIKAILRMFLWDNPRLLFYRKDPRDAVIDEHIDLDILHLSKMGALCREKFEKIRSEIPPSGLKLELDPEAMNSGISLNTDEFSTLSSVIEFGTVSTIVDFNELPDVEIYQSLISLRKNKIIRKAAN